MSFTPPCQRPENDPEDWFIRSDGKQYPDDDILISSEYADIHRNLDPALAGEARQKAFDAFVDEAEAQRTRERLTKRRHAVEKCFNECLSGVRLRCLEAGIEEEHGIWGGYTEKQRRQIVKAREERKMEDPRAR